MIMKVDAPLLLSVALLLATPVLAQPSPDESPLASYPGFGHDAEADEEQFEREEMARERLIARCMEREGFRYTPAPSILLDEFDTPAEAITTRRVAPNERYVRNLPEEERTRYRLALYGVEDPTSEDADAQPDPAEAGGGCLGAAMRALPGVFAGKAALQQEYDALRRSFMNSLRVKAAERRWAACMERLGHDLDASPRALQRRHDAELARTVSRSDAEPPSREALATLGEKHRAERRLTMRCAREVDLPGVVAEVRVDYEARFVAEHKETLDRHLEQLRAQQPLLEEIEATLQTLQ